ncbi:MAG: oxidoreductase [Aeromicrobium erythreum]
MTWTTDDIGDLTGRRALVTGGTGGLGFHTALELGRHGADVVITARSEAKASDTLDRLRREAPEASFDVLSLDLADLADVRRSADEALERFDRLDLLINNAGIMLTPKSFTKDGFELQMGTNHLGHFAFTAHLWDLLRASSARVVALGSMAHTAVSGIDLDVLTPQGSSRRFHRWQAYGASKLANLLFMRELDRRVKVSGAPVVSVAAHPGYSATNLTKTGPSVRGFSLPGLAMHQVSKVVAQSAERGAWPTLMAATDPTFTGGEYVGPDGFQQMRGRPKLVGMTAAARDDVLARRLWDVSEQAAGLEFPAS